MRYMQICKSGLGSFCGLENSRSSPRFKRVNLFFLALNNHGKTILVSRLFYQHQSSPSWQSHRQAGRALESKPQKSGKSCCRECHMTGGLLGRLSWFGCSDRMPGPAADDTSPDKMPPSLVLSCPCPCSFQKPGHQLTQGKNPDKTLGYINFFFLRTFLSAPICCWAWGRSIKTDKNESTNLWSSAPELGRFPGAGVSREEGEEAGEGQGEKMNSCRAIKPASLPYCPKQEAI